MFYFILLSLLYQGICLVQAREVSKDNETKETQENVARIIKETFCKLCHNNQTEEETLLILENLFEAYLQNFVPQPKITYEAPKNEKNSPRCKNCPVCNYFGEIFPGKFGTYFYKCLVRKGQLKPIRFICNRGSVFDLREKQCKKAKGGGYLIFTTYNNRCPNKYIGLLPYPSEKKPTLYIQCEKWGFYVLKCYKYYQYNVSTKRCEVMTLPTVLTLDESKGKINPIECKKVGNIYQHKNLLKKCHFNCKLGNQKFELKILCFISSMDWLEKFINENEQRYNDEVLKHFKDQADDRYITIVVNEQPTEIEINGDNGGNMKEENKETAWKCIQDYEDDDEYFDEEYMHLLEEEGEDVYTEDNEFDEEQDYINQDDKSYEDDVNSQDDGSNEQESIDPDGSTRVLEILDPNYDCNEFADDILEPPELDGSADISDFYCECEGNFRFKNSCTKYFKCVRKEDGELKLLEVQSCPSCLKFNAAEHKCDFPENIPECYLNDETSIIKRFCTGEGYYSIPFVPNKYYHCQEDGSKKIKLTVKSCLKGTTFNPYFSFCMENYVPKPPVPRCKLPESFVIDSFNCGKSYRCNANNIIINATTCPPGMVFNTLHTHSRKLICAPKLQSDLFLKYNATIKCFS